MHEQSFGQGEEPFHKLLRIRPAKNPERIVEPLQQFRDRELLFGKD